MKELIEQLNKAKTTLETVYKTQDLSPKAKELVGLQILAIDNTIKNI